MLKIVFLAAAVLAAPVSAAPAHAVYLSEDGAAAFLRGRIDKGDGEVFKTFVERPRAAPLKVIYLDAYGGDLAAGISIGTQLRNPDFAAFARSFGAHGETVTRTEEFAPALQRALACGTARAAFELRTNARNRGPP